jgi:16S rRNA (adenine1518-N6/adenine1519-N6)-dimethyltransferase
MSTAETSHKRPKLGQHFLADKQVAARIVEALGEVSGKVVVEIGPGLGVLTGLLAPRVQRLIAIELDRVLAAQLRMKYTHREHVEIIEADALSVRFDTILGPRPGALAGIAHPRFEKVRVIGNLPYYITSELLLHLFAHHQWFDLMILMVQLEVGERLAAKPGTRDYGLLSATAQLYAEVEKLFVVPPGAFSPPPKVHSALLRLTLRPRWEGLQVDPTAFIEFLKLSFGQKRKTLLNNLKTKYSMPALRAAFAHANVPSGLRAEALPLEKAAAIFRALSENNRVIG